LLTLGTSLRLQTNTKIPNRRLTNLQYFVSQRHDAFFDGTLYDGRLTESGFGKLGVVCGLSCLYIAFGVSTADQVLSQSLHLYSSFFDLFGILLPMLREKASVFLQQ